MTEVNLLEATIPHALTKAVIILNGKEIKFVKSIKVEAAVGEVTTVTISFIAEVKLDVEYGSNG